MADIREFARDLETAGLKVVLVPEFFSSAAAERVVGRDEHLDARAAALILQSYLDKQK
jgi:RNase H-fold protein (predicted Holliday junction resolvase)